MSRDERDVEGDPGPLETLPFPDRLTAHVCEAGPSPRLQGYDVQHDLAEHYTFGEVVFTALTGRAPERTAGRAFELAMTYLAPAFAGEAPTHAAIAARLFGGSPVGVVSTAALGLAEQARDLCDKHQPLFQLDGAQIPEALRADGPDESAAVTRLVEALRVIGFADRPPPELSLQAALHWVLIACGLDQPQHWVTCVVLARLGASVSEAFHMKPGQFDRYPMRLPNFTYVESNDAKPDD